MKKILTIGMWLMMLAACSGGQNKGASGELRMANGDTIDEQEGVQRMQTAKAEDSFSLNGRTYQFSISRVPADSLPKVKNDAGELFVDNVITLNVTRGTEKIFHKAFTKQSFSAIVPEKFLRTSILEGLVFDKTTPQGVVYAVSLSYPQTDLYFPIALTISPDGKMSMEKVDMMEDGTEY